MSEKAPLGEAQRDNWKRLSMCADGFGVMIRGAVGPVAGVVAGNMASMGTAIGRALRALIRKAVAHARIRRDAAPPLSRPLLLIGSRGVKRAGDIAALRPEQFRGLARLRDGGR